MVAMTKVRLLVTPRNLWLPVCRISTSAERFSDKNVKNQQSATVDDDDVQHHSKLANIWWNELGPMKGLHSLNKLRVQFVRDVLINLAKTNAKLVESPQPLSGIKILEVGCGGGIFAEPLARIGADVTGVDASHNLIEQARWHAEKDPSIANRIEYINSTIEDHGETHKECYDAVVASEVLEHVTEKDLFVASLTATLKPGGSVFITTINKTLPSWAGGIVAAEYLLRILPQGTHDWEKFIAPRDIQNLLEKYNCSTKLMHGMLYNFIANEWYWISNKSINYALHAVKKMNP